MIGFELFEYYSISIISSRQLEDITTAAQAYDVYGSFLMKRQKRTFCVWPVLAKAPFRTG